ncbi:hypothetical protein D3C85_1566450 [compost metagenome]
MQLGHPIGKVFFGTDEATSLGDLRVRQAGIQNAQRSFDKPGHLRCNHWVHTSHVGAHRVKLA